jgi:Zn finger protein HypA/HybF involved in hydrogenase expression
MSVNNADIIALLRKDYHEHKNGEEISQLTDTILIHLMKGGILTVAERNDHEVYRISSIPTRYQCTECNQISYIGDKEERKCFSCESENLRERNVR